MWTWYFDNLRDLLAHNPVIKEGFESKIFDSLVG
jgi:hypothetical protein